MVTAAILAIAVLLLPGVAAAHAGHHDAAAPVATASASAGSWSPIAIHDPTVEDIGAFDPVAGVLTNADAPGSPDAGICHAPCCCMTGGAGCASPALGPPSILALPPAFGHAAFEALHLAALPDALRQRLRKPPRA